MSDVPEAKAPKPKLVQPVEAQPIQENGNNLVMRVGERLHLELNITGERLWGELVGFKQGEFLLVWLPTLASHRKALTENMIVTVRGMNVDFQLCGFTTTISKTLLSPHPLVFLTFPNVFEKLHLRRHDRVECFLPASMLLEGDEYKAMVVNISQGGARIILDYENSDLSPDKCEVQEVFLVCRAVDSDKEVYAKALVRSARTSDSRMALGLEFLDLIGESRTTIQEYIASIKEYSTLK